MPVNVDLPLAIGIPADYIPDQDLRLRLYRRIADVLDKRRLFVNVPFPFARTGARLTQSLPRAPLSADQVTMLEAGRAIRRGRPEAIFGGHALPPGESGEGVVNVLSGRVVALADSLATLEIEPGLCVAVADDGGYRVGGAAAIELRGGEILLALGAASGLSAQNVLPAVVREIHLGSPAVVVAELGREARPISVVVSRRAVDELGLAPGTSVRLVFKAQACRALVSY